jgi:hypothetical protein
MRKPVITAGAIRDNSVGVVYPRMEKLFITRDFVRIGEGVC